MGHVDDLWIVMAKFKAAKAELAYLDLLPDKNFESSDRESEINKRLIDHFGLDRAAIKGFTKAWQKSVGVTKRAYNSL